MSRHKKVFNPLSLRDVSKKVIIRTYKDNWKETKVLPTCLQHELLIDWLHCDEEMPPASPSDDILAHLATFGSKRSPMRPMTTGMFIYLMRLPNEVPSFAAEENHVILDYYVWKSSQGEKKLCGFCYPLISKHSKPYSANLWLEKNWQFTNVQACEVYAEDELLPKVIWDEDYWCSNCIIEPLWSEIIERDDCYYDYRFHLKRRHAYIQSDSDSDVETSVYKLQPGNRMCPRMYSCLNKNEYM